jgi:hypothetical protein
VIGAIYLMASVTRFTTPAQLLTQILTVDGAGSTLDADTLDGLSSLAFVKADGTVTGATSQAQTFERNALAVTSTAGVVLQNTTAATVGTQNQYSPTLQLTGQAWDVTNTTSRQIDFRLYAQMAATATTPSGLMAFGYKIAPSANFTDFFRFHSDGQLIIGTGTAATNNTRYPLYLLTGTNHGIRFHPSNANNTTQLFDLSDASARYCSVNFDALAGNIFDFNNQTATGIIRFRTVGTERLRVDNVGVITQTVTSTDTNAIRNVQTLIHRGGTAAAGFGLGIAAQLESSTTNDQDAGRLTWKWATATHASRASQGQLTSYYTSTERPAITWGSDSSVALLSFYDVTTPIARAVLATGAGATVDNVITALQNLGLIKQS